jgi:hypothetical protein
MVSGTKQELNICRWEEGKLARRRKEEKVGVGGNQE